MPGAGYFRFSQGLNTQNACHWKLLVISWRCHTNTVGKLDPWNLTSVYRNSPRSFDEKSPSHPMPSGMIPEITNCIIGLAFARRSHPL